MPSGWWDWKQRRKRDWITSSPKPRHLSRYSVFPFLPTLLSITCKTIIVKLQNLILKPFPQWTLPPYLPLWSPAKQEPLKQVKTDFSFLPIDTISHDNAGALLIPPLNIVWPPGFFFHRQSWIYISGVTLLFTGQTLDHILTQQFPLRPSCWPPASASCSTGCSTCQEPHIAQNPRYSGQVPTLQTPMAAHQLRCYKLGFK